MKFTINALFTVTSLVLATGSVLAHDTDAGLRGGGLGDQQTDEAKQQQQQRNLQTSEDGSSLRTPIIRSVRKVAVPRTGNQLWPFGGFNNPPAFNKMSFDFLGADLNLAQIFVVPQQQQAIAIIQDRSSDDNYQLEMSGVELPPSTTYRDIVGKDVEGCFTTAPQAGEAGRIPVLQAFILKYSKGNFDRNVGRLAVKVDTAPGTNQPVIRVCHADRNNDDVFNFVVKVAFVEEAYVHRVDEFTGVAVATDDRQVFNPPANTVGVINGFDVRYLDGSDRDMNQLTIDVNPNGRIFVDFSDDSKSDRFEWEVSVAYIGADPL